MKKSIPFLLICIVVMMPVLFLFSACEDFFTAYELLDTSHSVTVRNNSEIYVVLAVPYEYGHRDYEDYYYSYPSRTEGLNPGEEITFKINAEDGSYLAESDRYDYYTFTNTNMILCSYFTDDFDYDYLRYDIARDTEFYGTLYIYPEDVDVEDQRGYYAKYDYTFPTDKYCEFTLDFSVREESISDYDFILTAYEEREKEPVPDSPFILELDYVPPEED